MTIKLFLEKKPSNLPDPGLEPPGTPAQTNQIILLQSKPTPKFIVRRHPDPRIKKTFIQTPSGRK